MDPLELEQLVRQPRSSTFEYRARVPSPGTTAKLLAAFANAQGGTLVIGLRRPGEVVGIPEPALAAKLLARALAAISPPIAARSELLELADKTVMVIRVEPELRAAPHLAGGQLVYRADRRVVPMPAEVLYALIQRRVGSVGDLWAEVKRLTDIVAQQNKQVFTTLTWRDRVGKLVIGGIIGAIVLRPLANPARRGGAPEPNRALPGSPPAPSAPPGTAAGPATGDPAATPDPATLPAGGASNPPG